MFVNILNTVLAEKIQNTFKYKTDSNPIPQRMYYYKSFHKMIMNAIEIIFDFLEIIQTFILNNYPNGDLKSNG